VGPLLLFQISKGHGRVGRGGEGRVGGGVQGEAGVSREWVDPQRGCGRLVDWQLG
jgi:hypothetical protein